MASPTTRGKYRKQALGEGLNTLGLASGLNGLFDVMDEAVHGVNEITLTGVAYTLTSTNYSSNDIRYRQLKFTGNFAATITIPATQNWWVIQNATGQTLTFSNGSNTATLANTFYGLLTTNGTTVTMLTLPDGTNVKTVADNIASVNQVATDSASVIAVAAKSTEVGRLGTAAAVEDMELLGTTANVTAMAELGTSANVTAQGHLGTSANVTAQGHLGTAANVVAQGHLGTSANVTAMGNLGTSANVTNMANLSPQAVRDDMSALGTSAVRADMAALAETDVLADMAALGDAAVVTDLDLLGTTANVTAMGHLGTSANVTAMGHLGTSANVTAQGHLGTSENVTAMGELGTSANVTAMGHLGTSANVTAMGNLGTTQNVANQALLGTSANVTNMATLAPISGDITTTAGVSTAVTAYAKQYSAGAGSITTRGDGTGSVAEGDIRFRTDTDAMTVYNGTAWEDVAVTAGSFLQVSNNLSDLNNATTSRTNLGVSIGSDVQAFSANIPTAAPGAIGNVLTSNGSAWTSSPAAGGGGSVDLVADGAVSAGDVVRLLSTGKVKTVTGQTEIQGADTIAQYASGENAESATSRYYWDVSRAGNFVVMFWGQYSAETSYNRQLVCALGTIDTSANTITWSDTTLLTGLEMHSSSNLACCITSYSSSGQTVKCRALLAYGDNDNSGYQTCRMVEFGSSVTLGSASVVVSNVIQNMRCDTFSALTGNSATQTSGDVFLIGKNSNVSDKAYSYLIAWSGTTISSASTVVTSDDGIADTAADFECVNYADDKVMLYWLKSNAQKAQAVFVDSGEPDPKTAVELDSSDSPTSNAQIREIAAGQFCALSSNSSAEYIATIFSVDGAGSITGGDALVFYDSSSGYQAGIYTDNTSNIYIITRADTQGGGDGTNKAYLWSGAVTGSGSAQSVTFAAKKAILATWDSAPTTVSLEGIWCDDVDSDGKGILIVLNALSGDQPVPQSCIFRAETSTRATWLGIADASVSDTATVTVNVNGSVAKNGISSLTTGSSVYIAADGSLTHTSNAFQLGRAISATSVLVTSTGEGV